MAGEKKRKRKRKRKEKDQHENMTVGIKIEIDNILARLNESASGEHVTGMKLNLLFSLSGGIFPAK